MAQCPNCKREIADNAVLCPACGHAGDLTYKAIEYLAARPQRHPWARGLLAFVVIVLPVAVLLFDHLMSGTLASAELLLGAVILLLVLIWANQ